MRNPRPAKRPVISDNGALSIGGAIEWFSLSLNITAPDLDADAVTVVLGVAPTETGRRGVPGLRTDGAPRRHAPAFGRWTLRLTPDDTDEWDVCEAVKLLTARLPTNPAVWARLPPDARVVLRIALDLQTFNQGFALSSESVRFIAASGASIDFDIYNSATGEPGSAVAQAREFFRNMKRDDEA